MLVLYQLYIWFVYVSIFLLIDGFCSTNCTDNFVICPALFQYAENRGSYFSAQDFDKYLSSLLQISAKFAVTPFLGIS